MAIPGAQAATTVIDAGLPAGVNSVTFGSFSGPYLAAGRIFWAVRGRDGAASLRVGDDRGNVGDLLRVGPDGSDDGFVRVSASGTHLLFQREGHRCLVDAPCKEPQVISDDAWSGRIGAALTPLFSCPSNGCGETVGEASCDVARFTVGGRWASAASGCYNRATVLDLDAPKAPPRTFSSVEVATAGSLVVTIERSAQTMAVVRDLDDGNEAYRVALPHSEDPLSYVSWMPLVQSNGTVVLTYNAFSAAREVYWASPADPALHRVDLNGRPVTLSGGRLVSLDVTPPGPIRLTVSDLSGSTLRTASVRSSVGELSQDDDRFAWAIRPCHAVLIVVRSFDDARAPDPFTDHSACPVPEVSRKTLRLDVRRRGAIKIACPTSSELGCRGTAQFAGERPAAPDISKPVSFSLPRGEVGTLPVRLTDRLPIPARLRVTLTVAPRATAPPDARPRTRVVRVSLKRAR